MKNKRKLFSLVIFLMSLPCILRKSKSTLEPVSHYTVTDLIDDDFYNDYEYDEKGKLKIKDKKENDNIEEILEYIFSNWDITDFFGEYEDKMYLKKINEEEKFTVQSHEGVIVEEAEDCIQDCDDNAEEFYNKLMEVINNDKILDGIKIVMLLDAKSKMHLYPNLTEEMKAEIDETLMVLQNQYAISELEKMAIIYGWDMDEIINNNCKSDDIEVIEIKEQDIADTKTTYTHYVDDSIQQKTNNKRKKKNS